DSRLSWLSGTQLDSGLGRSNLLSVLQLAGMSPNGTSRTFRDVRVMSAVKGRAVMHQTPCRATLVALQRGAEYEKQLAYSHYVIWSLDDRLDRSGRKRAASDACGLLGAPTNERRRPGRRQCRPGQERPTKPCACAR